MRPARPPRAPQRAGQAVAGLLLAGLLGAGGVLLVGCGSACSGSPADKDARDGHDARTDGDTDAALVSDAAPRRDAADAAPPADACSATTIQLPPSGTKSVFQVSADWPYVVYDETRIREDWADLFLFDLRMCAEQVLADGPGTQSSGAIFGDQLIYSAPSLSLPDTRLLWHRDLTVGLPVEIPGTAAPGASAFNGSQVLYLRGINGDPVQGMELALYDLQTGANVLLEPRGGEDLSLSPTHGAWVAPGGPGYDVYYMELASGTVHHVESTYDPWVAYTSTWGDWLVWEDDRGPDNDVYGLRLGSGEELRLTQSPDWDGRPIVRQDVMCYRTTHWVGYNSGFDLAVMDLTTGAIRRVTDVQDFMKCAAVLPEAGWLIYMRQPGGDYYTNEVWATNLRARGILDSSGHVVPETP